MEEHTNEYNAIATPWSRQYEYEQVLYTLKKASKVAGKGLALQIDTIRGVIGRGEHSVVYVGELRGSKRLITVKYDQRDFSNNFRDIISEIENLRRIDHPYIPKLIDFIPSHENGATFILMDYTPGESLQRWLNHIDVTEEQALDWTCQILDVLDYLHKGIPVPQKDWDSSQEDVEKVIHIIHGNIRTDNILLTPVLEDGGIKYEIRLINFKLNPTAKPTGYGTFSNAWIEGKRAPNENSLTPEEFREMASWDIYYTGAILFRMLTGIFPTRKMNGNKKAVILRTRGVTEPVIEIICKSLDTDNPENRYQTAEAMLAAICSLSTNNFQRLKEWMVKTFPLLSATKATQSSRKDTVYHPEESVRRIHRKKEKGDVFISYHMDTSLGAAKSIADDLERHGISCWYAPRDVKGPYPPSIIKAIDNCKVFLLILNESATHSEHVVSELAAAFERFHHHETITLLPVRIDNCSLSDAMRYYLANINIEDVSSIDSVSVNKITGIVSDILKALEN